ncbi:50S ribosomal protein L24 [uncultured archaeon]|nr:50S ribosomal protein L24 [uncultured archaeon]
MKFNKNITSQPRKKRRNLYHASLHERAKLVKSHISEALQAQLKKKTMTVKKGFKVKILRGKFKKTEGKVVSVDYKKTRVFVDSAKAKSAKGKEKSVGIHPSKLLIIEVSSEKK